MGADLDEQQAEGISRTLMGFVTEGLDPKTLHRYDCFMSLDQVVAKAPDGASEKKQYQAVMAAVDAALAGMNGQGDEAHRGQYHILTGRKIRRWLDADQVRLAIKVLLDYRPRTGNTVAKRYEQAMNITGIFTSIRTFNEHTQADGPAIDLMRVLARELVKQSYPLRGVRYESVVIGYWFVPGPSKEEIAGGLLAKASVTCKIRAMGARLTNFTDSLSYLHKDRSDPWVRFPFLERTRDAAITPLRLVNPNQFDSFEGLSVDFRTPVEEGELREFNYDLRWRYPNSLGKFNWSTGQPRFHPVQATGLLTMRPQHYIPRVHIFSSLTPMGNKKLSGGWGFFEDATDGEVNGTIIREEPFDHGTSFWREFKYPQPHHTSGIVLPWYDPSLTDQYPWHQGHEKGRS